MQKVKTARYIQSGWQEIKTGIIYEYYGEAQPPQDGSFKRLWKMLWKNEVTEISIVTPIIEDLTPA